jgi:hypothetical protein
VYITPFLSLPFFLSNQSINQSDQYTRAFSEYSLSSLASRLPNILTDLCLLRYAQKPTPFNSPAAIPTAEGAHDGGVPTSTSSTGRDDDGGVTGIVDVDGEDFAWVDQWMEDGGDAAGF